MSAGDSPLTRAPIRAMDASHEASIVLALNVAGIPNSVARWTGASPTPCFSIISVAEVDQDRAIALVSALRRTSVTDAPERRSVRLIRWSIAVVIGLTFLFAMWKVLTRR